MNKIEVVVANVIFSIILECILSEDIYKKLRSKEIFKYMLSSTIITKLFRK